MLCLLSFQGHILLIPQHSTVNQIVRERDNPQLSSLVAQGEQTEPIDYEF